MGFLLADTPNNLASSHPQELSQRAENCLPLGDPEIVLSLEQVAPLLRGGEIPVLATQRIRHRSDLRELTMQYPCHIRAPVPGGMGMTVANRIDAIAACQTLFSRKVNGAFPEYLRVEVDYSQERQLSLAIAVDHPSQEVRLDGANVSPWGEGSALEGILDGKSVVLSGNFEQEDGYCLASQLGFAGEQRNAIALLLEKLYNLMIWVGLTHCCLDSLALGPAGEVMLLSGQFTFGVDSPLKRQAQAALGTGTAMHPALLAHGPFGKVEWRANESAGGQPIDQTAQVGQRDSQPGQGQSNAQAQPSPDDRFAPPRIVRLGEGSIAVISNGFRRTMDTLERFQLQGCSVAAFVNLQDDRGEEEVQPASAPEIHYDSSLPRMAWTDGSLFDAAQARVEAKEAAVGNISGEMPLGLDAFSLKRQLCQALQALARLRNVKVILINWRSAQLPCRILADALVEYQAQWAQQARRPSAQPVSLVVRLAGTGAAAGYQRLVGEEVETEANLEGAIARSMGLARMGIRATSLRK